MSARVQRPHDKLFRTVFSDIGEAESFLRAHLPPALVEQLDWSTLALSETSFVDDALRESESDLLYTVQMRTTGEPVYLYLLFEHQSKPDKWMRFRLLKYMCRIWDESFKEHPDQALLRPIIPLVFYQGESRWHYSTEFADLFAEDAQGYDFLPHFAHYLIDQSDLSVDQTQGGLKAQVAQLLMMAAFQKSVHEALMYAARLSAQVAQTGGVNYMEVFVVYLAATQERQRVQEFVETVRQYAVDIGGEMLTYAEELKQEGMVKGKIEGKQEGKQEGKLEGTIETIESLLAVGAEWALITTATGITPPQFRLLKEQLRKAAMPSPTDDR